MKTLHVILFCFFSIFGYGQIPQGLFPEFTCPLNDCYTCGTNSSVYQIVSSTNCPSVGNGRNYDSKFMPSSSQPIIYIRANFIFLQRSDGTGNFQENNAEHQELLNDAIVELNNTYSNLIKTTDQACYKGNDFIQDIRVRFIVNKVYVRDNYGWNNQHGTLCPDGYNWYLNNLDNQIVNNPAIPRGINVYFTEDSVNYRNLVELQNTTVWNATTGACSQFPDQSNYSRTSKLHLPNMFSKYWLTKNVIPTIVNKPWNPTVRGTMINDLGRIELAHELGHSLWLYHDCPHYGLNACYYSVMNQSGSKPHTYLPPSEVGRIHAALSLTNLRSFIPDDAYIGVKEIDSIGNWPNMRLYNSLKINASAALTFACEMTMPYQSSIDIYGRLMINGANIKSIKNDWKGIVVKSGGLLEINSTHIADYNIKIENGGTVVINGNLTISGNHSITVENGGYICIKSNTNIHLPDYNSVIRIFANANIGTNPNLSVQTSCVSPWNVNTTGNGSIKSFTANVYIQNETISSNRFIGGKNIYVGYNVTTSKPQGNVIISNNANVIFEASENVNFEPGFECALGSTFEVVYH